MQKQALEGASDRGAGGGLRPQPRPVKRAKRHRPESKLPREVSHHPILLDPLMTLESGGWSLVMGWSNNYSRVVYRIQILSGNSLDVLTVNVSDELWILLRVILSQLEKFGCQ